MERGPLYKKSQFTMKGYSYPGKSPVKIRNYFTPTYFGVSDKTERQVGPQDYDLKDDFREGFRTGSVTGTGTGTGTDKGTKSKTSKQPKQYTGGKIDPELMLAAGNPFGYMIGKGLTALFNRKRKKEQLAEEGLEQEKKLQDAYDKGARTQRVSDMSNEEYLEYIKLDKKGRDEYLKKNPTRKKSKKTNTKIKPKHETRLGPMIVGENK